MTEHRINGFKDKQNSSNLKNRGNRLKKKKKRPEIQRTGQGPNTSTLEFKKEKEGVAEGIFEETMLKRSRIWQKTQTYRSKKLHEPQTI